MALYIVLFWCVHVRLLERYLYSVGIHTFIPYSAATGIQKHICTQRVCIGTRLDVYAEKIVHDVKNI